MGNISTAQVQHGELATMLGKLREDVWKIAESFGEQISDAVTWPDRVALLERVDSIEERVNDHDTVLQNKAYRADMQRLRNHLERRIETAEVDIAEHRANCAHDFEIHSRRLEHARQVRQQLRLAIERLADQGPFTDVRALVGAIDKAEWEPGPWETLDQLLRRLQLDFDALVEHLHERARNQTKEVPDGDDPRDPILS